jgi:tetratricopeptide (TPR) repeat protein
MNDNLLTVMQKLVVEQGEDILSNPNRIRAFLADYANREPKAQRNALVKCVEYGFYDKLKNTAEFERPARKTGFAQKLYEEEGLDLGLCKDSVDLLEAALFGKVTTAPEEKPQQPQPAQKYAPDHIIDGYIRLGDSYYNQKHYDKAIAEYTRAILLDPNSSAAYKNCGVAYYSKGDYNVATLHRFSLMIIPVFVLPATLNKPGIESDYSLHSGYNPCCRYE